MNLPKSWPVFHNNNNNNNSNKEDPSVTERKKGRKKERGTEKGPCRGVRSSAWCRRGGGGGRRAGGRTWRAGSPATTPSPGSNPTPASPRPADPPAALCPCRFASARSKKLEIKPKN